MVQARNFRFQCGLVYVAEPGYVLLFLWSMFILTLSLKVRYAMLVSVFISGCHLPFVSINAVIIAVMIFNDSLELFL